MSFMTWMSLFWWTCFKFYRQGQDVSTHKDTKVLQAFCYNLLHSLLYKASYYLISSVRPVRRHSSGIRNMRSSWPPGNSTAFCSLARRSRGLLFETSRGWFFSRILILYRYKKNVIKKILNLLQCINCTPFVLLL